MSLCHRAKVNYTRIKICVYKKKKKKERKEKHAHSMQNNRSKRTFESNRFQVTGQFIFARSHDRVLRQFESGEVQREKRCVGNNAEKFGTRAINQRAVTLGHRIESSRTEAR